MNNLQRWKVADPGGDASKLLVLLILPVDAQVDVDLDEFAYCQYWSA